MTSDHEWAWFNMRGSVVTGLWFMSVTMARCGDGIVKTDCFINLVTILNSVYKKIVGRVKKQTVV